MIIHQNQLVAYMLTGAQFAFKGQRTTLVPEYGHAAVASNKREYYQCMYMHLSQGWVNDHSHLHIIAHFAHDRVLQETLYHLGFGAILAERLRELSAVVKCREIAIAEEQDVSKLIDLQIEHNRYYPNAPIFIQKLAERQEVLADLETHARQGDVFFVYYDGDAPGAYMIVGESNRDAEGEGFLLQQTNTAQIKSAYARSEVRRKGVGKALLQATIQWSKRQGYERLFVEHETANFYGGNFWDKHFTPYLYFSMRYVDNTI